MPARPQCAPDRHMLLQHGGKVVGKGLVALDQMTAETVQAIARCREATDKLGCVDVLPGLGFYRLWTRGTEACRPVILRDIAARDGVHILLMLPRLTDLLPHNLPGLLGGLGPLDGVE